MDRMDLFEKVLLRTYAKATCIEPLLLPDGRFLFGFKGEDKNLENVALYLSQITSFVSTQKRPLNVVLFLGPTDFEDKLLYILFESYIEYLICKYSICVQVVFDEKTNIATKGIKSSPLQLLKDGSFQNRIKFLGKHKSEIYLDHFRQIYRMKDTTDEMWQSKALTNVSAFLKGMLIPARSCNAIAEIAIELVGNAVVHAKTDCLLDIDIADNYYKKGFNKKVKYFGANICVIDFSSELLGTQIQSKICLNPLSNLDSALRYRKLKEAYTTHIGFFNELYTEDDFFILSAFQNRISGRPFGTPNGGTGLPKLVKSLETQADAHNCYAISGKRVVRFLPQYLEYDDQEWLGMNQEHDFFHNRPNKMVFGKSPVYFPGTAFNLNFVIAKEES